MAASYMSVALWNYNADNSQRHSPESGKQPLIGWAHDVFWGGFLASIEKAEATYFQKNMILSVFVYFKSWQGEFPGWRRQSLELFLLSALHHFLLDSLKFLSALIC